MAQYTDEEIIIANQGRIEIGDYVIFKGNLSIKWASQDVSTVNIMYEKRQANNIENIMIVENRTSNPLNTYVWVVDFSGNPASEYPIYRIKVVSTESNNVVAYSNKFKVSVDMSNIINQEELPLFDPNTIVAEQ